MEVPPVAIFIKTFNRPHQLTTTVTSIRKFCTIPYRLYISDDGEIGPDIAALYSELDSQGHVIVRYNHHVNVTKARNDLVGRLQDEEFVLRLDDDFNFTDETNLEAMLRVIRARSEIGAISGLERQIGDGKKAVSGSLSIMQGHMLLDGGGLLKENVPHQNWLYFVSNGIRFAYANFTRNFLLIRRDVFRTVRWNESLVVQGEHTAFMLDLQRAGWALAFTPESIHVHNESAKATTDAYRGVRHSDAGRQTQRDTFKAEYGIETMSSVNALRDRKRNPVTRIMDTIRSIVSM